MSSPILFWLFLTFFYSAKNRGRYIFNLFNFYLIPSHRTQFYNHLLIFLFNKNGDKTRHTENNLPLSETKKVNIVTNIGGAFYLNRDPAESLAKNSVVSRRGASFGSEALEAPRAKVFRFQIRISIEQLIVPLLMKHMIGCPIRGPVAVPWKCLIFSTAQ